MRTQTKYEEILLSEIRALPVPLLPQALKMVRLLKEGVLSVAKSETIVDTKKTGFCGEWHDERSAEEIVADIAIHRSGFGGRRVEF